MNTALGLVLAAIAGGIAGYLLRELNDRHAEHRRARRHVGALPNVPRPATPDDPLAGRPDLLHVIEGRPGPPPPRPLPPRPAPDRPPRPPGHRPVA